MKVIILGVDGMLGHKIAQTLQTKFTLICSSRKNINLDDFGIFNSLLIKIDFIKDNFIKIIDKIDFDIIINCTGVTSRRGINDNFENAKFINSELPRKLTQLVIKRDKKLIHFSTDCVFDGKKGNYLDDDKPDEKGIYGKSKAMGEIISKNTLVIRTSIIGRELFNHTELFEWLFSMKNRKIQGYKNVIFSGVTTLWISNIVYLIISKYQNLSGIINVSSKPISKYELLLKLKNAFQLNIKINPNYLIKSNKVLISKKFTEITGINSPNWDELITKFKEDCDKYSDIYKK